MARRDDSLDLPGELKGELRGMYTPGGRYRGDDRRVLDVARAAGVRRAGYRRWAVGIGIAASVAIAAGLFALQAGHTPDAGGRQARIAAEPVAGSFVATGDIRDAFYVVRELKAHAAVEGRWDANHDGVVDGLDVQTLAIAAVKVDGMEKGEVR